MSIGSQIKKLREEQGLSQEALGNLLGKTRSAVSQYESDTIVPRMGVIEELAHIFHVDKATLIDAPAKGSLFVDVPLYGSIAAGTPIEMTESDGTGSISARKHAEYPDAFLLKVEGESMNRILPNGAFALVDPCDDVERDMQPYAVCVNGYDATVKRVRKLNNGFELVPDSTDPTYKPILYDYGTEGTDTVTVIGRVVYYVLPDDWTF